jgi:hypothetical protein
MAEGRRCPPRALILKSTLLFSLVIRDGFLRDERTKHNSDLRGRVCVFGPLLQLLVAFENGGAVAQGRMAVEAVVLPIEVQRRLSATLGGTEPLVPVAASDRKRCVGSLQ